MRKLFFAAGEHIFYLSNENGSWLLQQKHTPYQFRCLVADPTRAGRLYGGSFNNGLWLTDDYGATWQSASDGIIYERVLSLAVSKSELINGKSVVWAGTEPSALFRSIDGGSTWTECQGLQSIPSKSTWSFPPRPHTHHVRSIQPDLHRKERIFVGVELGGVMQSDDRGLTWQDRKLGSQYDCHTLTMSPQAKDCIYEAAGGGFAQSLDGGKTWKTFNDGLDPYTYLVSLAVDSGNPDTIIASAAKNARTAYMPERAHSILVRKEKNQPWERISLGLPEPDGSSTFLLLADASRPGEFFAVNNLGIYHSADSGKTWQGLPVEWPDNLLRERIWAFTGI